MIIVLVLCNYVRKTRIIGGEKMKNNQLVYLFDYTELRRRIKEKLGTEENYCKAMGFSRSTKIARFKCNPAFNAEEIARSCDILDITDNEIAIYFFTNKVR